MAGLTRVSPVHPGLIAGVIRDERGAPVEGARVYFAAAPAPTPDVAALTGSDGSFSLAAPVEGTYTLECSAEGFAARRTTVASAKDSGVELTLRPQ